MTPRIRPDYTTYHIAAQNGNIKVCQVNTFKELYQLHHLAALEGQTQISLKQKIFDKNMSYESVAKILYCLFSSNCDTFYT